MYDNVREFGAPSLLPEWMNKRLLHYESAAQVVVMEGYLTLLDEHNSWQIKFFQLTRDRLRS
jgi:hypothetical protein